VLTTAFLICFHSLKPVSKVWRQIWHRESVKISAKSAWCSDFHERFFSPNQTDQPSRFFWDSPGLGHSVPESRTLSSGCPNFPVYLQTSRGGIELNPHNQLHCFVWPLLITIYCLQPDSQNFTIRTSLDFDMKMSVIRSTQLHMYCRLQHIA